LRLWGKSPLPRTEEDDARTIPTLALAEALSRLPRHRPPRVLDLGTASGRNVDFFSRFGCRLEIFDLRTSITEFSLDTASSPSRVKDAIDGFLARSNRADRTIDDDRVESGYDLILCWDLLDYIGETEIAELFRQLLPRCGRGTRLLIFVSYRSPIPSRPRRYQIVSQDLLSYEESGSAIRTSPRFKEPKLRKLIPGLEVESCFLMRHGVQEYLFAAASG